MTMQSPSEEHGIALLRPDDLVVLSVGISTGGDAEIRMVRSQPGRYVVATTLDEAGAQQTQKRINQAGLSDSVTVKVEDICQRGNYHDEQFDYIYARLVLHYLSASELVIALDNIFRLMKKGGRLFVVVRSTDCPEVKQKDNMYNPSTKLTTYKNAAGGTSIRYFHTQQSITDAIKEAGFSVIGLEQYDETLSPSFGRDNGVWVDNNVIEVLAEK